jgi:hypothetical protein
MKKSGCGNQVLDVKQIVSFGFGVMYCWPCMQVLGRDLSPLAKKKEERWRVGRPRFWVEAWVIR